MSPNAGIASSTFTFILAGGRGQRLYPLTYGRAKPVVPFGAVHRLIDFTLSNCFNSGLRDVHILTQYQCESLHSYVEALAPTIPNRGGRGKFLRCICPASGKRYRGTADAVFQNLQLLTDAKPKFVVILSGDHVYRMDYRDLVRFHSDRGADATIAGVECPRSAASQFGVIQTDSDGHIVGFEEKPDKPKPSFAKPSKSLVSMGVYVFNTRTLMDVLSEDAVQNTSHDFGRNIVPHLIRSNKVSVYNFTEIGTRLGSYWRDIGTVDAYYRAHIELLLGPAFDPYDAHDWPLCCLDEQVRPAHWKTGLRTMAFAVDSIVSREASLCRESGVVHSVLSPGVQIKRCAKVDDSILLHNVHVGTGARIQRAILDENVRIADGVEIGYDVNKDREYGLVTDNGIVVIPANTYVGPSQAFRPPQAKWRTELIERDRIKCPRQEEVSPTAELEKE